MLTATSEYALRALTFMAHLPHGEAVLGRDLARATQVPPNYLSKILLTLRNAGILDSTRGSGGGYRLRKHPDEIFLIDVVELFEGSKAKPQCLLNNRECSNGNPCSAHRAWKELTMAYNGFLISTSISMVAGLKPMEEARTEIHIDDLVSHNGDQP